MGQLPGPTGPPVFIVGCGRSGTTLLRMMLDAHPAMAIPPESHFISRLWSPKARYDRPDGFDADELVARIVRHRRFPDWELPEDAVRGRVRALARPDFASVVEAAFMAYADAHGATRWGDKTPNYVDDLPLLSSLFPKARFVHVVRDGRDVAPSLLEMDWGPPNFVAAATLWRDQVRIGRRDGTRLGPGRYREVPYEDLVANTEGTLREVCAFVDLEFQPELLAYHARSMDRIPAHESAQHRHLGRPPTAGLRDWRRDLPPRRVALFEAVAGDELQAFGYERAFPHPSPGVRLQAAAGLAANAAVRGLKQARKRVRRRAALTIGRGPVSAGRR